MSSARVRFAPSPTGHLHLGNARTALFNYLFARHEKGRFILRIEDTDLARSRSEFFSSILNDLRWLGVVWDEGPTEEGPHGPYRQSERGGIYHRYLVKLLQEGKAYPCFCTAQELQQRREAAVKQGRPPRYDNRCRNLSKADQEGLEKQGRKASLRFKVEQGTLKFKDSLRGEVSFDLDLIGDFVIQRSDGRPIFHFVVCVDDGLMKISHVIRGEDHLSNTPRHILLFKALGFPVPQFVHLSMIAPEGGGRLSKREKAPAVSEYREKGILPEALVNYLALLGWSPEGEEILSIEALTRQFSLKGLVRPRASLNHKKLEHINAEHIRKKDPVELARLIARHLVIPEKPEWFEDLVRIVQDHLIYLSDIKPYMEIMARDEMAFGSCPPETQQVLRQEKGQRVLRGFREALNQRKQTHAEDFQSIREELISQTGLKGGALLKPIRVALTGERSGPELHLLFPILGKERILSRVEEALAFGKEVDS